MASKKASAVRAFTTGIVCIVMVGFGWLSDPLTAADQTGALSTLLAWSSLAAAAIALIVAIYFTCRAIAVREPQQESDLESEEDINGRGYRPVRPDGSRDGNVEWQTHRHGGMDRRGNKVSF
jgi:hypothetical protein